MKRTMNNELRILILGFILLFSSFSLLLTPSPVSAQDTTPTKTEYTLLAPLPLSNPGGTETDKATPMEYIHGLFRLIVAIAGGLAVVMIIYAGIKYMSTDAFGEKNEAKGIIENAIWGLLLAIGAWIILFTINPKLVEINLNIDPIKIESGGSSGGSGSGGGGRLTPIDSNARSLSNAEARARLGNNVTVVGNATLQGIKEVVIDEVLRIKSECNCAIIITSATGGSHASGACSHANGYKVDIRKKDEGLPLSNHIKSKYTQIIDASGRPVLRDGRDPMWRAPGGAIYTEEPTHWDVVAGCR